MMRSMYSGVSGLRNHQLRMDVIGNNIANVNTYGYKASRATFAEMYNQTLKAAAKPTANGNLGGTNPRQVGLGVYNSSIDVIHTMGAAQVTDRNLDICIVDEGFITVRDGESIYYTRSGNLYVDPFGYLVTAEGMYVQGMMLIGSDDLPDTMTDAVREVLENDPYINWGDGKEDNEQIPNLLEIEDGVATGVPKYMDGPDAREELYGDGGLFGRIVIPNVYTDISISDDGTISAIDENGEVVTVGVLVTTTFMNPGGLDRVGSNLYRESNNSGIPGVSLPGTGPSGPFKVGALEMSTVDLSKEFTDMIVTQRGFQANSRIITVSDTLLEELVNLKR